LAAALQIDSCITVTVAAIENGRDNSHWRTTMKKVVYLLAGILSFSGAPALADAVTEQEVIQTIIDSNAYSKRNLKDREGDLSNDGSVEFWSSGGLMHEIPGDAPPSEYEALNIDVKHIQVITLVPGQAAVAQYYSEGSMKPKGSPAVSDYRTRVTQVFVKESGQWKVRAAHWSPIASGSGTNQTSLTN
jgi:hypothetical protein